MAPAVSVVLTAHERVTYLPDAVRSVRDQVDGPETEILVVDDGSATPLETSLGAACAGVRWIRQEHLGVCAARARGTTEARHDLVAYLDDDDLCLPDRLRVQAGMLEEYPDVDMVCGDLCGLDENPEATGFFSRREHARDEFEVRSDTCGTAWIYPRDSMVSVFLADLPLFPSTLMVRTGAVSRIGGWDSSVRGWGDCHDFFLRANHRGTIALLGRVLTRLRRGHADHMTADVVDSVVREAFELCRLMPLYPVELQRRMRPGFAAYLSRIAHRCKREGRRDEARRLYFRAAKEPGSRLRRRLRWVAAAALA